jgi:hypothetical protein
MHKGWKKIVDFLGWGCRRAMREREGVGLRKKEIMLKCCSVRCECDRHYTGVYNLQVTMTHCFMVWKILL